MKIGIIIKQLRINKKILSKNLYQNLLTRAAIVKFEKGESDTSSEKFLEILDRLNITLEEFHYIYIQTKEKDELQISPSEYMVAFYNRDVKKLKHIAEVSENKYFLKGNIKDLHSKILSNVFINTILDKKNLPSEMDVIKDYLLNCNSWGYYELTLFINTLDFYSEELIDITFKKTKANLNSYEHMVRYRNEVSILLLNILDKHIRSKNYKSARKYYKNLFEIKNVTLDNMYLQSMIKYFGEILDFIEGKVEAEENILKIIEVFYFLDMEHKARQCKQLFDLVKSENI